MSALGQKQTFAPQKVMSALPSIADMCSALVHVRYGPKADIIDTQHIFGFNRDSLLSGCRWLPRDD
jgi:hypothetical protein